MKKLAILTMLFAFNSYSQNGELDLTFASDGIFEVSDIKQANSIATDNSENIFCTGVTQNSEAVVLKLTPNGQVDNSFGNNGSVIIDPNSTGIKSIVDNSGKILCLTESLNGGNLSTFKLVRLNIDGSLDNNFGDNGVFLFDNVDRITPISFINFEDGFLIYSNAPNTHESKFIKILSNGTLDLSFGDNGIVTNYLGEDQGRDFLIDSNNNIYTSGDSFAPSYWVRKYNSSGQLDSTFGDNGIFKTELYIGGDVDDAHFYAMELYENNLYLSGEILWHYSYSLLTAIIKLSTDGEPDLAWGQDGLKNFIGYVSGDANSYSFSAGKAIITHPTGKIIFGGPFASNIPGEERNFLYIITPSGGVFNKNFFFSFSASYKSFCFQNGDQLLGAGYTSTNGHLIVNRYNVGSLGTDDYSYGKDIVINPNPVMDNLFINTNKTINSLEIFNTMGQKIFSEESPNINEINVSVLSNGVYFLKLTDEENNSTIKKFIKE
ncbi:T9SS type A sorting domain-containing protein [Winogradskyella sediminis]|uniref:T9SS type A sorting domain-containing protein n=1 Tax=Winogradskyella sediminis TaxID=1382466 RepID=UPI003AA892C5